MPRIQVDLEESSSSSRAAHDGESFRIGTSRSDLTALRRHEVNVAIWRRWVSESTRRALEQWAPTARERASATIDAQRFSALRAFPALATIPDAKPRAWLASDIDEMVRLFAELTGDQRLHASFGGVHSDRCRKFHVDYVRMRLIATYAGPGTEWLPNYALHRDVLKAPPECHREANAAIVKDRRLVRRVRAGDVIVLKGELAAPGCAAVHRSPPVESAARSRVMLTLTTLEASGASEP